VTDSLSERLKKAAGGGARMSDYDGRVITVVSIEVGPSQFEKGGKQVTVTAIDDEANEVTFYATPTGGRQLIAVEEELPLELTVVSFPGQFGKTGYRFEASGA